MNQTTDKIISKIKKEQLKPLARWKFRLREGGLWFGFGAFMILSILSFGLLWYFWSDEPWFHGGQIGFGLLFARMPIVFFILIVLGMILALFDFRKTGRGYKFSLFKIVIVIFGVLILASAILNYSGISQKLDKVFGSSPLYQDREAYMKEVWQKPSAGRIAGEIVSIIGKNSFVLSDFDGKTWKIDSLKAVWRHGLKPEIGLKIKMLGSAEENDFIALDIRPWMGAGGCGMSQNPDMSAGFCGMMK